VGNRSLLKRCSRVKKVDKHLNISAVFLGFLKFLRLFSRLFLRFFRDF
jgi:hypothetical protein